MKFKTLLRLGRVSNLPTVGSNTFAAIALAGAEVSAARASLLAGAMSLFYVGGMFLNDAYDHAVDAQQRPHRPIPSGAASRSEVLAWGYALLLGGAALIALHSRQTFGTVFTPAVGSALALGLLIVAYDLWHKQNPLSPVLMALCRLGVYVTVAWACTATPSPRLWWGGLALTCYLIGLTYIAKQEDLRHLGNLWPAAFLAAPLFVVYGVSSGTWGAGAAVVVLAAWVLRSVRLLVPKVGGPDVGRAVVALIAGISLLDAALAAALGHWQLAAAAVVAFGLTLALQRWVSGT